MMKSMFGIIYSTPSGLPPFRNPLSKYVETAIDKLDQEKLPILLTNKHQSWMMQKFCETLQLSADCLLNFRNIFTNLKQLNDNNFAA
jgi:hypothetical protein